MQRHSLKYIALLFAFSTSMQPAFAAGYTLVYDKPAPAKPTFTINYDSATTTSTTNNATSVSYTTQKNQNTSAANVYDKAMPARPTYTVNYVGSSTSSSSTTTTYQGNSIGQRTFTSFGIPGETNQELIERVLGPVLIAQYKGQLSTTQNSNISQTSTTQTSTTPSIVNEQAILTRRDLAKYLNALRTTLLATKKITNTKETLPIILDMSPQDPDYVIMQTILAQKILYTPTLGWGKDGNYYAKAYPDTTAPRAQVLQSLYASFSIVPETASLTYATFEDTPRTSWYYTLVLDAYNAKIIDSVIENKVRHLRPLGNITRKEFATITERLLSSEKNPVT